MATTKFYLDKRSNANVSPLKLSVRIGKNAILLSLGVKLAPSQWDEKAQKIINHPGKLYLNAFITSRKQEIDMALLDLMKGGRIRNMSFAEIKNRIQAGANGGDCRLPEAENNKDLFAARFKAYKESRDRKKGTYSVYRATYNKLRAYAGEEFGRLKFEDITKDWLTGFDTFLQRSAPSRNARNIHLRNIRTVFNAAIDDGITTAYPFRRFKIRPVATAKRALSAEQMRALINRHASTEEEEEYRDMFSLIFYLIGINTIDLFNLRDIVDGRIEYYRRKTNRLYSIKVETEALEIINKYRGKGYLLNVLDRFNNYRCYAAKLNRHLQRFASPVAAHLTTYWARHTWATIAASLDIPKETIAAALGHGGNTVTDIYIDFDRAKIDDANRRVIDFVLYGKK